MTECPRETQVLAAALDATPGMDADLTRHIAECETCREILHALRTLRDDERALARDARLPGAGLVWWRASLRARAEAAETAGRPIAFAHAITVAAVLAVGCAFAGVAWRMLPVARWIDPATAAILAAAAVIVLSPLALVVALARDRRA